MSNSIRYYVETIKGQRIKADWLSVETLVRLHGYKYILREPNLEVVAK